jgi:hypothetical protein
LLQLRSVVVYPHFITGYDSIQKPFSLIPVQVLSQKPLTHFQTCSFLVLCKKSRNPPCRDFSVTQVIWNDGLGTSITYPNLRSDFTNRQSRTIRSHMTWMFFFRYTHSRSSLVTSILHIFSSFSETFVPLIHLCLRQRPIPKLCR